MKRKKKRRNTPSLLLITKHECQSYIVIFKKHKSKNLSHLPHDLKCQSPTNLSNIINANPIGSINNNNLTHCSRTRTVLVKNNSKTSSTKPQTCSVGGGSTAINRVTHIETPVKQTPNRERTRTTLSSTIQNNVQNPSETLLLVYLQPSTVYPTMKIVVKKTSCAEHEQKHCTASFAGDFCCKKKKIFLLKTILNSSMIFILNSLMLFINNLIVVCDYSDLHSMYYFMSLVTDSQTFENCVFCEYHNNPPNSSFLKLNSFIKVMFNFMFLIFGLLWQLSFNYLFFKKENLNFEFFFEKKLLNQKICFDKGSNNENSTDTSMFNESKLYRTSEIPFQFFKIEAKNRIKLKFQLYSFRGKINVPVKVIKHCHNDEGNNKFQKRGTEINNDNQTIDKYIKNIDTLKLKFKMNLSLNFIFLKKQHFLPILFDYFYYSFDLYHRV